MASCARLLPLSLPYLWQRIRSPAAPPYRLEQVDERRQLAPLPAGRHDCSPVSSSPSAPCTTRCAHWSRSSPTRSWTTSTSRRRWCLSLSVIMRIRPSVPGGTDAGEVCQSRFSRAPTTESTCRTNTFAAYGSGDGSAPRPSGGLTYVAEESFPLLGDDFAGQFAPRTRRRLPVRCWRCRSSERIPRTTRSCGPGCRGCADRRLPLTAVGELGRIRVGPCGGHERWPAIRWWA